MRQEIEVMRVLRVPPMGKLVIEVNGERYEHINEITNEHGQRRLLAAVGELITFAGGYDNLVDAGLAPPSSAPSPAVAPAEPEAISETDRLNAEQARFINQLERQRDALKAQAQKREADLTASPAAASSARPQSHRSLDAGTQSVAAQIDAILQELKAEDPAMASRIIRLQQNPAGGLHIGVDGKQYNEPGEIEDMAVQKLIKQAVHIWRER